MMRIKRAKYWLGAVAGVLCWLAALAGPATAQGTSAGPVSAQGTGFTAQQRAEIIAIMRQALRTDPSLLRDAITALQEDESRRKNVATQGAIADQVQALTRMPGDPEVGNPAGDVTIVEFYDVRCPYCRRMVPVLAELLKRDPKLRIVYKDFPILGPASVVAARALLAAHKQGGYAKLHAVLMTGAPNLDTDGLRGATQRAGLDWARLQADMDDPEIMARINTNLALGKELDIQGTPAYVIGDRLLPGAVGIADLEGAVRQARRK